MPSRVPVKSAPKRRRAPQPHSSSPSKGVKRQTKLDFSARRSVKGSSSSPAKPKPDITESSETEDASSDVNEVRFEEPGKPSTQRVKIEDSSEDGVAELESSEEEEDVPVARRRVVKKVVDVSDSEDEDVERTRRVRKGGVVNRGDGVAGKKKGTAQEEGDVIDVENDSEDEGMATMSAKRAGKRKAVALSLTPTSEDELDRKRDRIARGKREEPKAVEESEEEEDDIMDGLDEDVVLDSRLRSAPTRNSKMAQMRENLARLKRRKLGQDTPPVQSSSDESEGEDEDEEVKKVVRPRGRRVFKSIPGAQPTLQGWLNGAGSSDRDARPTAAPSDSDREDGSDDQDSWIEDDGGEANVPILPEEYSMFGHQSLAHHFKVVMQMFVHLACTKPRKRLPFRQDKKNDEYFGMSLRALRRKLDGMRDSLVVSSVWTSGFKKALNSHPELNISVLEFAVPGCGACRISSRMSTFRGTLDGDNYDRETFEPIVKNESSDSEPSEDQEEEATSFVLGRFCKSRVRCYHRFAHWEVSRYIPRTA
ncbi:hypothetical protein FRC12_002245 [Ceratobasidium sp. 428]|nr:hypothetical protein FRC12_002245 [Ceratobasidium sp. 428]